MRNSAPVSSTPSRLAEHPAGRAWRTLTRLSVEPTGIDVLKKRSSAVYLLHGAGPNGAAIVAKWRRGPQTLEDLVYRGVLPRVDAPVLDYHGCLAEPDGAGSWLFLEYAEGELYSPGQAGHRELAARWLAALHTTELPDKVRVRLPDRGPGFYLGRLDEAYARITARLPGAELTAADQVGIVELLTQLDLLRSNWGKLEAACSMLPTSIVHGDLACKNLRVCRRRGSTALLAFDWETAGLGFPGIDLAQFTLKSASPDLDVYRAAVAARWPGYRTDQLQLLVNVGNMLRLIWAVEWESWSFGLPATPHAAACLADYGSMLGEAVAVAGWMS